MFSQGIQARSSMLYSEGFSVEKTMHGNLVYGMAEDDSVFDVVLAAFTHILNGLGYTLSHVKAVDADK